MTILLDGGEIACTLAQAMKEVVRRIYARDFGRVSTQPRRLTDDSGRSVAMKTPLQNKFRER